MIKVVAAILIHKDRILIARRAPHKSMPGKWEFPGGKVEPGESEKKALSREFLEEFGVQIEVEQFFAQNIHDYGEFKVELRAYFSRFVQGEWSLRDHDRIEWVGRQSLKNYDLTQADLPFARLLESG